MVAAKTSGAASIDRTWGRDPIESSFKLWFRRTFNGSRINFRGRHMLELSIHGRYVG